jgi:5-methylcytosine-specific restriction endonuclease McrA
MADRSRESNFDYEKQRRAAIARDGKYCRFERLAAGGGTWFPCGRAAHATAHIYRRRECARAADHVDVVLRACVECHDVYDGRTNGPAAYPVRVPADREARAFATICANSKVNPPRRAPEGARL